MTRALVLLAVLFGVVGCSSVASHRAPGANLARYKHYYVEHRLTDDRKIDEAIVAELQSMGVEASAGPLTMMPQSAEAVVTYADEWAWDFKSYIIRLTVQIRDARKDYTLATGVYEQPSMITKTPSEVVHAVLSSIFTTKKR